MNKDIQFFQLWYAVALKLFSSYSNRWPSRLLLRYNNTFHGKLQPCLLTSYHHVRNTVVVSSMQTPHVEFIASWIISPKHAFNVCLCHNKICTYLHCVLLYWDLSFDIEHFLFHIKETFRLWSLVKIIILNIFHGWTVIICVQCLHRVCLFQINSKKWWAGLVDMDTKFKHRGGSSILSW